MNQVLENTVSYKIYYRIIALWILCEGMLGGIIHGFKLPITGMVIGSGSIICISLIAYFFPGKGNIIKATIVVMFFKMMISPYSPPTAYIALFFQGFFGETLFHFKKNYKITCWIFAIITMLESAWQRIIIVTVLYGLNFWKALNNFINELTQQKTIANYSLIIALVYIICHLIIGIIVGWFAGNFPKKIKEWKEATKNSLKEGERESEKWMINISNENFSSHFLKQKRKKKIKIGLLVIWFVLIILYTQSTIPIGKPLLPSYLSLQIFIRSILIVLGWYLIISPLLIRWLKVWLEKKQSQFKENIQQILQLLPLIKQIVEKSWILSSKTKGWKRIYSFTKIVLINTLHE